MSQPHGWDRQSPPPPPPAWGQPPSGPPSSGPPHSGWTDPGATWGQAPASPYGNPYGSAYPGPTSANHIAEVAPIVRTIGWIIAGLGALVVVAAFLPWLKLGGRSVSGIGGEDVGGAKDGVVTLFLALIAIGFGLPRALIGGRSGMHLTAGIIAVVCGTLIALTALVDIGDVNDLGLDVGVGLWLTFVGGFGLLGVGIWGIVKRT